jgi:hypothetical protein
LFINISPLLSLPKEAVLNTNLLEYYRRRGPLMVAQWLRYCATNRKVAGEHFLGVKAAGA